MLVTMMKAKLHRATVTQADLEYEGSIAIDRNLLDVSGILPHEQVLERLFALNQDRAAAGR